MRNKAPSSTHEAINEFRTAFLKAIAGIVATGVIALAVSFAPPLKAWLAASQSISGWHIAATCTLSALLAFALTFAWLWRRIATLQRSFAEVRDLATRDSLTGLYSHSQIAPILSQRIAEASDQRQHFSVIMVDIDGFKCINDSYSHTVGNRVLEQVARELPGRSGGDTSFRFGGDEFIIVSKVSDRSGEGYGFAERVRRDIAAAQFLVEENSHRRVSLTVSCGVTISVTGDTAESIVERVSLALHDAKRPRVDADGVERSKNFVFFRNAESPRATLNQVA
jgi:diguanylate cyclase (GGDEF)-like protein